MDKAERETMTELETASMTASAPRTRRKPGPKPGTRLKPKAAAPPSNGHVVPPVSALAALRHELATTEAAAGRIRKALAVLQT